MNFARRLRQLRHFMAEKNVAVSLLLEPDNQHYFSGFRAISFSRPIILLVSQDATELIIPELEEQHAKATSQVNQTYIYYEHPEKGDRPLSYLDHLQERLSTFPKGTKIGVEFQKISTGLSFQLQRAGFELVDIGQYIIEMRFVKDSDELGLLIEAGALSDIAINRSLQFAAAGISELEFDSKGNAALLELASKSSRTTIIGFENWTCSGIVRSVMPHLYSSTRVFCQGDMVIHSRQVWVNGYRAENERTFFIGKPSPKQLDVFKVAVEAQQAGLNIIRPGITAKEVDLAAYEVIRKAGYGEFVNHRTGHGLGLTEHEEPYLRFDSDLILQEGMVFTIEPGIYVPGVGGFRHSDTVILQKNGALSITNCPRDVEQLIFN